MRKQQWVYFNSHPHEEDDVVKWGRKWQDKRFQLTSSRRGWHHFCYRTDSICDISTHILTKRMTSAEARKRYRYLISTHILTKRMTKKEKRKESKVVFQLTSSRRGWRNGKSKRIRNWIYFNSHPHEEDDVCQVARRFVHIPNFNSHPHEEDDIIHSFAAPTIYISTHILTKRMTQRMYTMQ